MAILRSTLVRDHLGRLIVALSLCTFLLGCCTHCQRPDGKTSSTSQPQTAALVQLTGTFIDRADPAALRFVSYNVQWNCIFDDVNPLTATRFARVIPVLDPDVLALQEIGVHPRDRDNPDARKRTAEEVLQVMNAIAPPPPGQAWHAYQGYSNVIVSKYPLKMAAERPVPAGQRDMALALVDLPNERFGVDLYVLNNHYKCCGDEANDPKRQQQSDAIINWIRDARTPGGNIDLPANTAIVVAGDLNIVGGPQPLNTLIDGNIIDESRYGTDFAPDWDGTPFTDAHPVHNLRGPDDYTWRNDTNQWPPGRLDYIIYSDSTLSVSRKFIVNTTTMSDEELLATGLEKLDITVDEDGKAFDHLPLVVDFRVTPTASKP